METVAALLDGFVSITYANYYLYFNGNKQGYYSYLVLTAVEGFSVLIFIYFIQINLQSSTLSMLFRLCKLLKLVIQ